jgi:ketosteroid isomerase-like protein
MSKENVEIVRRLYDAVARRDSAAVFSLYDPEVVIDGTRHQWAEVLGSDGVFRGHEGVREFSAGYYEEWEDLDDDLEELIDAGDRVVSISTIRARGRASGIEVEWKHNAGVWTIEHGRITRVVWCRDRDEALAAAGVSTD